MFWQNSFLTYLWYLDTSQLERLWRNELLLLLTKSHVVFLCDFCECWQAWSCTNIMCRAACTISVLHECFSECYNLSVENCSCLTFVLVGTLLSLSGRITHNMLCCGVTRTKFMDSLLSCFVAHLSLTHCYGLCHKWVHYRRQSISLFSKKRLILVRWLYASLLNGCHVCLPWRFLKVHLSEHHVEESNTRCWLSLTHYLVLHRFIFESK